MEREILLSKLSPTHDYVSLITNGTCDITGRMETCVRITQVEDGRFTTVSLKYLNEKAQQHGLTM